jgi:hypothetical protein
MKKGQQFWKDLAIVFSLIWLNLVLFVALMACGAILMKISGAYPEAGWAGLFLNAFHMAILERVAEENDNLVAILLSFLIPLGTVIILGEGVLRVFSIYIQKREHQEEWDIMVAKTFSKHIIVCGVGELGKALVKRIHHDHPETRIVLVDLRAGSLAETGLTDGSVVSIQADMTSMDTLKAASCQKARLILLAAGNDAFNLEAAYKVIQLNPQAEVWVRLHHHGLADLMDLSRKSNVHFFSPYQQAADTIAFHILQDEKQK